MRKVICLLCCCAFLFTGCRNSSVTYTDLTPVESTQVSEASRPQDVSSAAPQPTPEPVTFAIDRSCLPTDQRDYLLENNSMDEWDQLMNTLSKGGSFIACENTDHLDPVLDVFSRSPYSKAAEISYDSSGIHIEYNTSCSVGILENAVTALLSETVNDEQNTLETLMSVYRAAASFRFDVDEDHSLYRAFVNKTGDTREIAEILHYLLAQAGYTAYLAEADSLDAEHYWVIAELNGTPYHFDPVFESAATNGEGLSYFGMSDTEHAKAVGSDTYRIGIDTLCKQYTDFCPSPLLDGIFSDVTAWQNNIEAHTVTVQYGFQPENCTEYSTKAFSN